MDKTAFYDLSYGVYLCTSWDEGKPVGCVANSAMQITSQPATIAVSINKNNYTHKAVSESGHFALTVLGEGVDPALIGTFGFRTSRDPTAASRGSPARSSPRWIRPPTPSFWARCSTAANSQRIRP